MKDDRMRAGFAWPALLLLVACATARADQGPFLQGEGHLSIMSEAGSREHFARSGGGALKAGYRWGPWGAFGLADVTIWFNKLDDGTTEVQGAYDLGAGGEVIFAGGLLRSSLAGGASILMRSTELDQAGTVGVFVDIRPLGLRWALGETLRLGFEPLTLALLMPVLDGIPLLEVQYRTVLSMEYLF